MALIDFASGQYVFSLTEVLGSELLPPSYFSTNAPVSGEALTEYCEIHGYSYASWSNSIHHQLTSLIQERSDKR